VVLVEVFKFEVLEVQLSLLNGSLAIEHSEKLVTFLGLALVHGD
jgi:hypothetical protein